MPETVVCRCDPDWPAYAVCDRCRRIKERDELHHLLVRRGQVQPVVQAAYAALAASYDRDADDRAYDAASDYMDSGRLA